MKRYIAFLRGINISGKNKVPSEELDDILHNAPDWWGNENKEIYDNLIFIMPPATFAEVYSEIGEPKEELEKIKDYKEAIFWSFSRKPSIYQIEELEFWKEGKRNVNERR